MAKFIKLTNYYHGQKATPRGIALNIEQIIFVNLMPNHDGLYEVKRTDGHLLYLDKNDAEKLFKAISANS